MFEHMLKHNPGKSIFLSCSTRSQITSLVACVVVAERALRLAAKPCRREEPERWVGGEEEGGEVGPLKLLLLAVLLLHTAGKHVACAHWPRFALAGPRNREVLIVPGRWHRRERALHK